MPRKAFVADLAKAVESVDVPGISCVQVGADDGEFTFLVDAAGSQLQLSALVPDVSDYPSVHDCLFFAPDNAPNAMAAALSNLSGSTHGKTINQLLNLVSKALKSVNLDGDGDVDMPDSQLFDAESDFDEGEDEDEDDINIMSEEEYFPDDEVTQTAPSVSLGTHTRQPPPDATSRSFRNRIRADLRMAKNQGFKVGAHGALLESLGCYVSISCRIARLGISQEAMQAWQVLPSEYLILIIHYPNGYKSLDTLSGYDAVMTRRNLDMRVGISHTYKPTFKEAVHAFTTVTKEDERHRLEIMAQAEARGDFAKGFRSSFISRPLNGLLNERLVPLINYRKSGMPWYGAETFYRDHYGSNAVRSQALNEKYMLSDDSNVAYPSIVTDDHLLSGSEPHNLSFPLAAMQFVLRHFVRCTDFCLICFTKLPGDLEAIKPYVCENPLCLYQYMSLGFGPSIEHEILAQPNVVDLLISFCYSSAGHSGLEEFPTGLSLMIPPIATFSPLNTSGSSAFHVQNQSRPVLGSMGGAIATTPAPTPPASISTRFDLEKLEMIFDTGTRCPFKVGDWIVIQYASLGQADIRPMHCRVTDTTYFPAVKVALPAQGYRSPHPTGPVVNWGGSKESNKKSKKGSNLSTKEAPKDKGATASTSFREPDWRDVVVYQYNVNFDDLGLQDKRFAVAHLLDLLPSISEMTKYLKGIPNATLSGWLDRISPAGLGLLRWIIASNRACIIQVDDAQSDDKVPRKKKVEERIQGMSGWKQFRFAMGAPDKERRFINSIKSETDSDTYPTLFAWHGSPLSNWHSIIREGLHFNKTTHGRAFGNGVYHSLDVHTSLGYSGNWTHQPTSSWPKSELGLTCALALNEIVNSPKKFVSTSPHLVVDQLDWIQTRYLFVKCSSVEMKNDKSDKPPNQIHAQDPAMTPKGENGKLVIPTTAVSRSRRPVCSDNEILSSSNNSPVAKSPALKTPATKSISSGLFGNKKRKATGKSSADPIVVEEENIGYGVDDDDIMSVQTEWADLEILFDEDEISVPSEPKTTGEAKDKGKQSILKSFTNGVKFLSKTTDKPKTDFIPGTLDHSTLPVLEQPMWATSMATKRLQQDFKMLLKIQQSESLHELGWYIDPDLVSNMYQWIVELHSFEPELPLSKDMKDKNIKSIVLELRFGKDYPMSPPFVRVVRPRFLGFQQGGGGHVTAGGALCMELLTNNGWSAVSSIESVLLQVRMAMSSTDPRPARLQSGPLSDYGVGEAIQAYIRACQIHGWTVPPGFEETAYGGVISGR